MGSYVNRAGIQVTLAERWNGTAWSIQPTPTPAGFGAFGVLYGVSCTAANACTAVGDYVNGSGTQVMLAERWNGTAWSIQPTPTPAGASSSVLSGVSCTAASACTAVGSYVDSAGTGQTLAEQWNGTWSIQATANPAGGGGLSSVSCSAATACTALGQSSGMGLAERWNGSVWSIQTIATPTGATSTALYGVSCSAATACTAVGHWIEIRCNNGQPTCSCFRSPGCTIKQGPLVERWNGSAWSIQPTPIGGGVLSAVSCTATACTAVGRSVGSGTLAEQWNGAGWTIQPTPGVADLSGVSCTAATACTAVARSNGVTLAEGWNGTNWSIQSTPNPPGPPSDGLSGVSCPTTTACTAVGSFMNPSGTSVTLAEYWNGTSWAPQTTLTPAGAAASGLSGVSCTTATGCTAAGDYSTNGGGNPAPDVALAEGWNDTSWAIQPTPTLTAGYDSALSSVSCTAATACTAVGYDYYNQGPQDAVLAEQWNGTSWATQPTPIPAGAYSSALASVSCATAMACIAVGSAGVDVPPLAEQWNGTAWTILTTAGVGELSGVSCPAVNACTAVGNSGGAMLAEQWNGTSWTLQNLQTPAGSNGAYLSGVSCTTATDCTAVGYYTNSSAADVTLAENWNGSAWTIQTTPNPPGAVGSYLSGVSCTTATAACTAVGHYQNQSNADVTLAEHYSG